MNKKFQEWLPH